MRILVTGSRDWTDVEYVWEAIESVIGRSPDSTHTIVHGCARGVDSYASSFCEENAFFYEVDGETLIEERHPADWNQYGNRAGFVRNAEMVNLGADVCLAFILAGSRGATGCANLAEDAGMLVIAHRRNANPASRSDRSSLPTGAAQETRTG